MKIETKNIIPDSTSYYDHNVQRYFDITNQYDLLYLYDLFLSHLPQRASILDAGCGPGRDINYFLKKGYKVTAFDGSEKMAQFAHEWTGIPVQHKTFIEFTHPELFDGVWSSASLLHIPKVELPSIMDKMKAFLKPNGVWYISFRSGKGECHEDERYFNDQTEDSLKKILEKLGGLEILYLHTPENLRSQRGSQFVVSIVRKT